ncbi:glycosyltransferase [Halalkalicoccus salilacus]|uniref:glycosyltransferase n=1 Tax=Halalkalicoccus salilacus TaxID=3117459 RepID=UPI00300F5065
MIFVTVGTRKEGFDRLVEWMDTVATDLEKEVIMQIGHTKTTPDNADWFRFKDDLEEIVELTQQAEIVVGHGGAGTILTTLETGTPIICVPRLEKYGENFDDHQLELTYKLQEKGTLVVAQTQAELHQYLSQSPSEISTETTADLVPSLRKRLAELQREQ